MHIFMNIFGNRFIAGNWLVNIMTAESRGIVILIHLLHRARTLVMLFSLRCKLNAVIVIKLCVCITGSDSESLQDDNVVGNISKYSVFAPGYSGPVKRGHLIFNADFECGN